MMIEIISSFKIIISTNSSVYVYSSISTLQKNLILIFLGNTGRFITRNVRVFISIYYNAFTCSRKEQLESSFVIGKFIN